jgi:hypothetical protein
MEMSDVAALLDTGAWTLIASRRVMTDARRLEVEIRELMLTYRAHRFRPISGGGGDAAAIPRGDGGPDRVRARLRMLVGSEVPKIYAGYTTVRRACDVCGREIVKGGHAYEITFCALTFRLDRDCFGLWQNELLAPSRGKA